MVQYKSFIYASDNQEMSKNINTYDIYNYFAGIWTIKYY